MFLQKKRNKESKNIPYGAFNLPKITFKPKTKKKKKKSRQIESETGSGKPVPFALEQLPRGRHGHGESGATL